MSERDGIYGTNCPDSNLTTFNKQKGDSLFWTALNNLADAVFIINPETTCIIACNGAATDIFGYESDEIIGQKMAHLCTDDNYSDQFRTDFSSFAKKDVFAYPRRILMKRKDGTYFLAEHSLRFFINNHVQSCAWIGIVRDISRIEGIKNALIQSEEKFHKAFHAAPVVVAITTATDGRFMEVNTAFEQFTGYLRSEAVGRTTTELGIWEEPHVRENIIQTLVFSGTVRNCECRFYTVNGAIATGIVSAELMKIEGRPCVLWVIVDITIRKKLENTLRKSEEKYRLLFNTIGDAVMVYGFTPEGTPGNYFEINEAAGKQLGYTSPELLRLTPVHVMDSSTFQRITKLQVERNANKNDTWKGAHIRKNGQKIPVEISACPIYIGDKPAILYTARDLTAKKQYEDTLRKKEIELRCYASNLEDTNTALKVLLAHRDDEKKAFENEIAVNLKELIFPHIERLKKYLLNKEQASLLEVLETNMNNIFSPFLRKLTMAYSALTPTEFSIANLIKEGKTSKEIANLLHVSKRTIDSHRNNIRDKLKLTNKNINLRNHLRNI